MSEPRFSEPRDFPEACQLLLDPDDKAAALAGGTWIMRSRLRQEKIADHIVSLAMIPELQNVTQENDGALWLGSMVTHTQLANATANSPGLRNLYVAAAKSANPNVRNVATVGGNICATEFSAADLVPALLSLEAEVSYADQTGSHTQSLADFLQSLPTKARVVRGVRVPPASGIGAHIRLPLRSAGDYPVAIISGAVETDKNVVTKAAISLGAVEDRPRRWADLETVLTGQPLDPAAAEEAARELVQHLSARTSIGTPAQYRLAVTPSLVRKFIEAAHMEAVELMEASGS